MRRMILLILLACISYSSDSNATSINSPLIVNIDNPNFRKLIAAIPTFIVHEPKSSELQTMAESGASELARLLTFTSMFNEMSGNAYKDLLPLLEQTLKKEKVTILGAPTQKGMGGIDVAQWKAIGIESLTIGELSKENDGIALTIRTFDINRSQLVLGKLYRKINPEEFKLVIRRYADLLLQAYTGRPGIFSSKIVFIGRKSRNSHKQVYISDFDGSNAVQITTGSYPHLSPAWSPEGRFMVFTSYERGNPDLFIYELKTRKKRLLSGNKGLNSGGNFAYNNSIIAYTGSEEGDANIYTLTPQGTNRKILIKGSGLDVDPAFSPDGKWMAFVSGRFGNPHIFRATLAWESNISVKVVEDKRLTYAGWYNATPAWSPESDKIAFAGYDKDIDRFDLFMMNPDGTNLERLTLKQGDNESPSWAPNSQMLVFHSNRVDNKDVKGAAQLYIMNRDGSNQRKLETGLYEAQTPKWSGQLD